MAGWTALLVWADREPVQRRGVLLLTVCPVLIGLFAAGVYAIGSGLVRPAYLAPTLAFQLGASVLFLAAYRRAQMLAHGTTPRAGSNAACHTAGPPVRAFGPATAGLCGT
jgi:hypothetical protein